MGFLIGGFCFGQILVFFQVSFFLWSKVIKELKVLIQLEFRFFYFLLYLGIWSFRILFVIVLSFLLGCVGFFLGLDCIVRGIILGLKGDYGCLQEMWMAFGYVGFGVYVYLYEVFGSVGWLELGMGREKFELWVGGYIFLVLSYLVKV